MSIIRFWSRSAPLNLRGSFLPAMVTMFLAAVLVSPAALARPCRVDLIPNGSVAGCLNCHFSIFGGTRNSFGKAIEPLTAVNDCVVNFWGPALAAADSDGDGRTNGEELGDPEGLWKPGDPAPGNPSQVTLPGVSDLPRPKAEVTAVDPREVSTLGGTAVTVTGQNFQATTKVLFGTRPLDRFKLVSESLITGVAPALDPTEAAGPRDVTASDDRGTSILHDGVIYRVPLFGAGNFVRGDENQDGAVDITDAIAILQYLFLSGARPACLDSADADDNGVLELSDSIFLLDYLFLGGPSLPSPYPVSGPDPTADALTCGGGTISDFQAAPATIDLPSIGSTAQLVVTAKLDGATIDLHQGADGTTYSSSMPGVVAVYRDGMVEALAVGAAQVTVRNGDQSSRVDLTVTAAGGDPAVKVLAASELGLTFLDRQFSVFSIHPPASSLRAQVVRKEATGTVTVLDDSQVEVRFSPLGDARGSQTSTSVAKCDFWAVAPVAYGWNLPAGQGLRGLYMPNDGPAPGPRALSRDAAGGFFKAEAVPILATDDAGQYNPFPLLRLTAYQLATGTPLAHTDVVLAVGQQIDCRNCHATGGIAAPAGTLEWSEDPEVEVQSKRNILLLHDVRVGTSLAPNTPVACTRCHYSAIIDATGAGPGPEQAGILTLSRAIHGFHARQVDSGGAPIFPADAPASATCSQCHPSTQDQSSRGVMHAAGIECRGCHGAMLQVGADQPLLAGGSIDGANDLKPRRPWKDQPRCGSCHTGDALDRLSGPDLVAAADGLRLQQAFRTADASASPLLPANKRFAESDRASFRESKGHGGLLCEGCHGSPHAEWPNPLASHNDNLAAQQIQGHAGAIMECDACHALGSLALSLDGPHGMHNVNDMRWVKGGHGHFYEGNQGNQCRVCHGADLLGTPLSKTSADRVFRIEDNLIVQLPKGTMVRCNHCHGLPGSGTDF